ncbi:unnamed protein product [Linum tenue]|uniref:Uncharacterized protein n=1 Tax=Linum tenue TaxID=586396 RepID=A0AAV0H8A5_9ROSI|nr:unnamed protein product [Linum tenue]
MADKSNLPGNNNPIDSRSKTHPSTKASIDDLCSCVSFLYPAPHKTRRLWGKSLPGQYLTSSESRSSATTLARWRTRTPRKPRRSRTNKPRRTRASSSDALLSPRGGGDAIYVNCICSISG